MEELIKQVVSLLKSRENNCLELAYQPNMTINKEVFITAQTVRISQVDLLGLIELKDLEKKSDWVHSILEGLSFGVSFEFQLACSADRLLPLELISHWQLVIYDKQGYRLRSYPTKAITYQQVALLAESDVLLIREKQVLTALAKETLQMKEVVWIERCGE